MISSISWCPNYNAAVFSGANTQAERCARISACRDQRTASFHPIDNALSTGCFNPSVSPAVSGGAVPIIRLVADGVEIDPEAADIRLRVERWAGGARRTCGAGARVAGAEQRPGRDQRAVADKGVPAPTRRGPYAQSHGEDRSDARGNGRDAGGKSCRLTARSLPRTHPRGTAAVRIRGCFQHAGRANG